MTTKTQVLHYTAIQLHSNFYYDGVSLVNIIAQMENAPDSIRKETSSYIIIEHGKKECPVFSSVKNYFDL